MFQRLCALLMAVINFIGIRLFSWPVTPNGEKLDLSKFELVWEDSFDGESLNPGNWRDHASEQNAATVRRGGWWHRDMAQMRDGMLYITTDYKEEGIANGQPGYYTYGMDSKGLFEQQYGYFEIRCKLPEGEGTWAAFWMLSDGMANVDGTGHDGAEIDVFESAYYVRKWPFRNSVSSAVHIDGYGAELKSFSVGRYRVPEPYTSFNTYGVEWNEDEYIFYINGVESGRGAFDGTPRVAQYLLLSVEFGGENGVPEEGWAGDIRNNQHLPSAFVVDYVRAYQYKEVSNG